MTDFMYAGDLGSTHSNTIIVDTVKHPESLSEHLRTVPGWETLRYQAVRYPKDIYHPTAEHLWKEWERVYSDTTLDDKEREARAEAFFESRNHEMNANVEMLWEEALPYVSVRKEIVERGYHSVMRELQNDARDPAMSLFKMNQAVTFSVHRRRLSPQRRACRAVARHRRLHDLSRHHGRTRCSNQQLRLRCRRGMGAAPRRKFHEPRLPLRRKRIHTAGVARPRPVDRADGARHSSSHSAPRRCWRPRIPNPTSFANSGLTKTAQ